MKMLTVLGLVLAGCASSGNGGKCGMAEPVTVIYRSNHFWEVTVRDVNGARLGDARGIHRDRFTFCAWSAMPGTFILDPIGGGMGYVLHGLGTVTPGSTVLLSLGSELRISFVDVVPPSE